MVTGALVGAYRIRPIAYPAIGRSFAGYVLGRMRYAPTGMRGGIINHYQLWEEGRRGASDPRMAQSEGHFRISDPRMAHSEPHFQISDPRKLKSEPHFGVSDTRKPRGEGHFGVLTPGWFNLRVILGFPRGNAR